MFETRYRNDVLYQVGLTPPEKKEVRCGGDWIQMMGLSSMSSCDKRGLCGWICFLGFLVLTLDAILLFPMAFTMGGEEYEMFLFKELNITKGEADRTDWPETQFFLNGPGGEPSSTYIMVIGIVLFAIQDKIMLSFTTFLKAAAKIHPERGVCAEIGFTVLGVAFDVLQLLGIFFPSSKALLFLVIAWPVKNFLRLFDVITVLIFRSDECSCSHMRYSCFFCVINGLGSDAGGGMEDDSLALKLCRLVVEAIDLAFSVAFVINRLSPDAFSSIAYLIFCGLKILSVGLNIAISASSYVLVNFSNVDRTVNGAFACTLDIVEGLEKQERDVRRAWRTSTFRFAIPLALLTVTTCVLVLLRSLYVLDLEFAVMITPYGIGAFGYALIILCNVRHDMPLRDLEFVGEIGVKSSLLTARQNMPTEEDVKMKAASLSYGLPQTWAQAQVRAGVATPGTRALALEQAQGQAQAQAVAQAQAQGYGESATEMLARALVDPNLGKGMQFDTGGTETGEDDEECPEESPEADLTEQPANSGLTVVGDYTAAGRNASTVVPYDGNY